MPLTSERQDYFGPLTEDKEYFSLREDIKLEIISKESEI